MDAARLAELEAEELHARRRRDLYKAKVYGPRATDPAEMRELERVHASALERLRHARAEQAAAEEPAGEARETPEPPAKVTLEDVSRLSPEHAPDDPDG